MFVRYMYLLIITSAVGPHFEHINEFSFFQDNLLIYCEKCPCHSGCLHHPMKFSLLATDLWNIIVRMRFIHIYANITKYALICKYLIIIIVVIVTSCATWEKKFIHGHPWNRDEGYIVQFFEYKGYLYYYLDIIIHIRAAL